MTFRDWRRIEAAEVAAALDGNPREKFVSVEAMLEATESQALAEIRRQTQQDRERFLATTRI